MPLRCRRSQRLPDPFADLHDVFEAEVRAGFSFLERDYGFEFAGFERSGVDIEASYLSAHVAVVILLERASSFVVGLTDVRGKMSRAVLSARMVGLNEIMLRRTGEEAPAIVDRDIVREDLAGLVGRSAAALRQHAEPVLRGDFGLLEEVLASRADG